VSRYFFTILHIALLHGTADEGLFFYRTYGDSFSRHVVFYKIYENEHFLLNKKHFSKAMASSIREMTQLGCSSMLQREENNVTLSRFTFLPSSYFPMIGEAIEDKICISKHH